MTRPKCIFCRTTDSSVFNTKEHIIPESLGGGDWALLPDGLFCDSCQNKFGSTIEQQALGTHPLSNFRTLLGIPTKKGKAPWFSYWEGKLTSGGGLGKLIYEPNSYFKESTLSGQKKITIIPTMSEKRDMLLRTLLKIGLETFAADLTTKDEIFLDKFDAARVFALTGKKNNPWFYIQKENTDKLNYYLKNGITHEEWSDNFYADVHEIGELIFLHFKLIYIDLVTPLIDNVIPEDKLIKNIEDSKAQLVYV
ncbi:HNH endonuclease [Maribacter arenosus]|uniref:HNH endonuclease 5 domain-containing protein n=1 Tax=Maribacter arenosus TaxID=1854708 RepID=A0ABR7VHH6_9FLAO|nr:HNH endonuclease [Maribacter arenosus]MBD0851863.1 hypothetical protein [Maribacter arenosus]